MVEAVVRLKKHCDEERKSGKFVSTKDSAKRTADALGIGVATVKRIMSQYKKDGNEVVVRIKERPGRPPSSICPIAQPIVREFVRNENLGGRRVSIDRVCKFLNVGMQFDQVPTTYSGRGLRPKDPSLNYPAL